MRDALSSSRPERPSGPGTSSRPPGASWKASFAAASCMEAVALLLEGALQIGLLLFA